MTLTRRLSAEEKSVYLPASHLHFAVGMGRSCQLAPVYQQAHGYPVGNSGKELQARAHGQKYWIAPAKREVLVGLRCVVGVRGAADLLNRIPDGLAGTLAGDRYGLPFAGDNQFLFNRIDLVDAPVARWFVPVQSGETPKESTRLTTRIDRGDASRTKAPLFAPTSTMCACPAEAWVDVGPSSNAGPS